ncbi:MAG TPA: hypothetical protein VIN11_07135, partial [Roseivirga sp.]
LEYLSKVSVSTIYLIFCIRYSLPPLFGRDYSIAIGDTDSPFHQLRCSFKVGLFAISAPFGFYEFFVAFQFGGDSARYVLTQK